MDQEINNTYYRNGPEMSSSSLYKYYKQLTIPQVRTQYSTHLMMNNNKRRAF